MKIIDTKTIYNAVYFMALNANIKLNKKDYLKLKEFQSDINFEILSNAYLADKHKRPLCQDTGLVVIFLSIGQEVCLEGEYIEDVINKAVSDCYTDNFLRKSVVKDCIFNRENTKDNTPCIIHTKITKGDKISILLGIKGGGAENMTRLKMMNPTDSIEDVINFVKDTVIEAGENACPPMTVGIGAGGTSEVAAIRAKMALFKGEKLDIEIDNVLETRIISGACHIASFPVCVNINCHSLRHMECNIDEDKIQYLFDEYEIEKPLRKNDILKRVSTDNVEEFSNLKTGDKVLLSGTIYTARDQAHKKLVNMIKNNEKLPFEIKNSIIFYAGPCPKKSDEIIGPIGPTTSKRMDKFAPFLYEKGVLATIGKGYRTFKTKNGAIYFKATGGVANLYKECVKSQKLICFEELGAEAVVQLEVVDMPLTVEIV